MWTKMTLSENFLAECKRHLNITWDDDDTDEKVMDEILDAEATMNHKLGAEIDYTQYGQEHRLFLAYLCICTMTARTNSTRPMAGKSCR